MSSIKVTNWSIPGSDGQPILGNTHWPHDQTKAIGAFICCHGFKGYKDYGFFPVLCDVAARNGLMAVRFNFSHSGMTNRVETFERPDLFEKDTWGRQQQDLAEVFKNIAPNLQLPRVLFGHSRGGVSSTLFAGNHRPQDLVGLITAAAPDYACNLDDLAKDQLRIERRLLSPSGRTGQDLHIGLDWLEEIEEAPDHYDPLRAAVDANCPMLVLHGDDDETVPLTCAQELHKASTHSSELAIMKGANHVFNCPNPVPNGTSLGQLPAATQSLINKSVGFAARQCENARS